jgi:hypothetical protein
MSARDADARPGPRTCSLAPDQPPISGRARVVREGPDTRQALAFERISISDHERLIRYIHGFGPSMKLVDC